MKWIRDLVLVGLLAAGSLSLTACGDDDPSGPNVPDAPGTPTGVSLSVTGQSITVSWDAVTGAETYAVVLTTDGEADRTQDNLGVTTATFSNLTPATTYFAQVTASNEGGNSAPATGTATTEEEPETVVQVTQDILTNTTWTSDKIWVLNQPIFVGSDCGPDGNKEGCIAATLTIEPGTTILGKSNVAQGIRGSYLVVSRGSRLVADATGENRRPTEEEVIVFTSDKPKGQRAVEDWGGLIINGQAPTNAGDEAQGEGDSGFYGGTDEMDDSGIIRGVRIEFAGDDVTPADQLNGLALQGVGAGTTVSYVQIHYNKDDGVEPFGGTVSVDHLVVTGIGDDSVDGTDGYRGFMQFILGQQRGADADNGFEISNNGDDETATPKSTAVLANATMIGARTGIVDGDIAGAESDDAIQMREGTNYRVYNSIFQGFGNSGLCIRDAVSIVNAQNR
ncbi:MAG: fibronectin type III domain-containing protein, partial [Longimicrobiales bacterium]